MGLLKRCMEEARKADPLDLGGISLEQRLLQYGERRWNGRGGAPPAE